MKKLFILLFTTPLLAGCQSLFFTGKQSVRWENDIAFQTITWDDYASEQDVRKEYAAFIAETLQKVRYKDYILLYQSNYNISEKERTYVIKIFKDETAKNLFLKKSDDIVERTYATAGNNFKDRWRQLQVNMPVEDVYKLLPELANYGGKQKFFHDHTKLYLGDSWFAFDFKGFLIDFGRGGQPEGQPTGKDWVF